MQHAQFVSNRNPLHCTTFTDTDRAVKHARALIYNLTKISLFLFFVSEIAIETKDTKTPHRFGDFDHENLQDEKQRVSGSALQLNFD